MSAASAPPPTSAAGSPEPPPNLSPYKIVIIRKPAELADHLEAWTILADHATEANAFYEPWALLPAIRAYAADEQVFFVLIYLPVNAQRRKLVLCGFFPLVRRKLHWLCPVPVVEMWKHKYCCLTVPLLRSGHAGAVLNTFFEWLRTNRLGGPLWRMEEASLDASFAHALTDIMYERQRPAFVLDAYCRAIFVPREDAETYLSEAISGRRRKDYRRKERQLSQKGRLECRVLEPDGDVAIWTEQFLQLEASGWKGREGTALACDPPGCTYFRELLRAAHERKRLHMLGLFLDDVPIAMKCNLLASTGGFAFKIAFNEEYAPYSPGSLLEIANIKYLHQHRLVPWMDSCAIPNHFMINRLWIDRRRIKTQLIATGRGPGDALVSLMPLGRWLKRKIRTNKPPIVHFIREED